MTQMTFTIVNPSTKVKIGNVYAAKGGNTSLKYWVITSITEKTVHCLGLDENYKIVSTTTYGRHVFEGNGEIFKKRELLGFCPQIADLDLIIVPVRG